MRNILQAPAALLLPLALALAAGPAHAQTAPPTPKGEICVEQRGAYLANITIGAYERYDRRWRNGYHTGIGTGHTRCEPFYDNDSSGFVQIEPILGLRESCHPFNLDGLRGRVTVVATGFALKTSLTCP